MIRIFFVALIFTSLSVNAQWEETSTIDVGLNAEEIIEYEGHFILIIENQFGRPYEKRYETYISSDSLTTWEDFELGTLDHALVYNDTIYAITSHPLYFGEKNLEKIYLDGEEWTKEEISVALVPELNFIYKTFDITDFYEKEGKIWIVSTGGAVTYEDGIWSNPHGGELKNYPAESFLFGTDEFGNELRQSIQWCRSVVQDESYIYSTSYQGIAPT